MYPARVAWPPTCSAVSTPRARATSASSSGSTAISPGARPARRPTTPRSAGSGQAARRRPPRPRGLARAHGGADHRLGDPGHGRAGDRHAGPQLASGRGQRDCARSRERRDPGPRESAELRSQPPGCEHLADGQPRGPARLRAGLDAQGDHASPPRSSRARSGPTRPSFAKRAAGSTRRATRSATPSARVGSTSTEILAVSSNICTTKIYETLGKEALYRWIRRFHFGESPDIQLPAVSPGPGRRLAQVVGHPGRQRQLRPGHEREPAAGRGRVRGAGQRRRLPARRRSSRRCSTPTASRSGITAATGPRASGLSARRPPEKISASRPGESDIQQTDLTTVQPRSKT